MSSASAARSRAPRTPGPSWSTCSSTATRKRSSASRRLRPPPRLSRPPRSPPPRLASPSGRLPARPPPSKSPPRHVVVEVSSFFRSFCSTSTNHDRLLSLVGDQRWQLFEERQKRERTKRDGSCALLLRAAYAIVPLFSCALAS